MRKINNRAQLPIKLIYILLVTSLNLTAQDCATPFKAFDCPQYPSYGSFNRDCFIKCDYPSGELLLPQAGVDGLNGEEPMHVSIPTNRVTWALGIAHAWNYTRNIIKSQEHPKISLWLGITARETGMACDCGAEWDNGRKPWTSKGDHFNTKCGEGITQSDGCFQMEFHNGWCGLSQTWPLRFRGPDEHYYDENISSGNFETSALGFAYRSIENHFVADYMLGYDLLDLADGAADPFLYEKFMASGWNGWAGSVQNNLTSLYGKMCDPATRAAGKAVPDWQYLYSAERSYSNQVGFIIAALEQETGASYYNAPIPQVTTQTPAQINHQFYGFYNENITWAHVDEHLTNIESFYHELTPADWIDVRTAVQAVYNPIAAGNGGTVPFRKLGPVMDEIIMSLPMENPMVAAINNPSLPGFNNQTRKCIGFEAPASHIDLQKGYSDDVCLGQTFVLNSIIDGGDGPNVSYQWYRDGVAIAGETGKDLTVVPNGTGVFEYSVEVYNPDLGGRAHPDCPKVITISNCTACGIAATASNSINTPCENMKEGSVAINVTGSTSYIISWDGEAAGSQVGSGPSTIVSGLKDGIYNFTVTDANDATCNAYLTHEVLFDTPMGDDLVANLIVLSDCKATLEAEIIPTVCECNWTVGVQGANRVAFEEDLKFRITPSNGGPNMAYKSRDNSNDGLPVEYTFSMCSGSIVVDIIVTAASGWCVDNGTVNVNDQNNAYEVYLNDENGVQQQLVAVPAMTGKQGEFVIVATFDNLTCPFTPNTYTYEWSPDGGTNAIANVSKNATADVVYTVTATNTANTQCKLTDTVLVPFRCGDSCVPPTQAVITPDVTSVCNNDVATLAGSQSNGYEYTWYHDGVEILKGLEEFNHIGGEGEYILVIADTLLPNDSTCMLMDTLVINGGASGSLNLGNDTSICLPNTILLNAGSGFASYSWNGGVPGTDLTLLVSSSSQVTVAVTNAGGCLAYDTININFSNPASVDLGVDTSICSEDSILLDAGLGFVSYEWNNGVAGSQQTFLSKATESINLEVIDSNGCIGSDTISINLNNPLQVNIGADTSFCFGGLKTVSAGNGFSNYQWNGGTVLFNDSIISIVNSTKLWVNVTDTNGCLSNDTINVVVQSATPVNLGSDTLICTGDSVRFNAGFGYVSYQWNDGAAGSNNQNLSFVSGSVWVQTIDSNNCISNDTVLLTVFDSGNFSLGNDTVICFGETNTIKATTGFKNYEWSNGVSGVEQIQVATSGLYSAEASLNGCLVSDSINLIVAHEISVDLNGQDTLTICPGSNIQLSPNITNGLGAYTYTWDDASIFANRTVNAQGVYSVEIQDSMGCTAIDTIQVVISNNLAINLTDVSVCEDSILVLDCGYDDANYTILWTPNLETTQRINANTAGVYSLSVSDPNGCSGTGQMTLTHFSLPVLDLGLDTIICKGDSIEIGPVDDFTIYNWSNNASSKTIEVFNGTNSLEVVDVNGCKAKDTIMINNVDAPKVNGLLTDRTVCVGVEVTFNGLSAFDEGNGPYTYLWSEGGVTTSKVISSSNSDASYSVVVTDQYGCEGYDTVSLSISSGLPVSIVSSDLDNNICRGDTLILSETNYNAINGYSFEWEGVDNNESLNVVESGVYSLVIEKDGCFGYDSVQVIVHDAPQITLADSLFFCDGENAVVTASSSPNNTTSIWNDNSNTIGLVLTTSVGGEFIITTELDVYGCESKDTIQIEEIAIPKFTLNNTMATLCEGQSLIVEPEVVPQNVKALWSDGSTEAQLEINSKGTYILELTTSYANCKDWDTVKVEFLEVPTVELVSDTTICEGQEIVLFANSSVSNAQFLWSTTEITQGILVDGSGNYSVEVSNGNCSASSSVSVNSVMPPESDLDKALESELFCFEDSRGISLSVSNNPEYNYTWTRGSEMLSNKNSTTVSRGGNYVLTIESDNCPDLVDQITIKEFCPTGIYIPNSLLPNSSIPENTTFGAHGNIESDNFKLWVFNRWGELIFQSQNPTIFWDGTYLGKQVQEDVYVWKVEYMSNQVEAKPILKSLVGHVAVIY